MSGEWEVTYNGGGSFTVTSKNYGCDFGGPELISGGFAYVLSLVGIIIMICNVPPTMIFPAILATLVALLPVLTKVCGGSFLAALVPIAKNGHYIFSVLVLLWWALYSTMTASEGLLIGLCVVTMYAMYYFPFLLIADASRYDFEGVGAYISAVICFVGSLIFYLIIHDSIIDTFVCAPMYFSTAIVVSGNILMGVHRLIASVKNYEGGKGALHLIVVVVIVIASLLAVNYVFPAMTASSYDDVLEMIDNGEYRRAREMLAKMKNNPEAAKKLEEIRFTALEVGEKVEIGKQRDNPDTSYKDNTLVWTVIAVEDGRALLFCDTLLTLMRCNPLSVWNEGNNVRYELQKLYEYFDEADREKIQLSTITTVAGESFTSEDHLFLLSREELEEYCTDKMIYSKTATSYYKELKIFEIPNTYYIRSVDKNGNWMVVDCDEKEICTQPNSYAGVRPAMYVSID